MRQIQVRDENERAHAIITVDTTATQAVHSFNWACPGFFLQVRPTLREAKRVSIIQLCYFYQDFYVRKFRVDHKLDHKSSLQWPTQISLWQIKLLGGIQCLVS